jgi:hypothetical protein
MIYFIIWILLFAATNITMVLLSIRIMDDLESELPIGERPSWRLWQLRRFPLDEIRRHRRMYPESS